MNVLKIVSLVVAACIAVAVTGCGARSLSADPETLASGKALYTLHCAACHGANLEGQPNWKVPGTGGVYPAPPHTRDGHTWHHPDTVLLDIIAQGGTMPNSAMPAFGDKLHREEMATILVYIKSFWGTEELEFQRVVTQSTQQ